MGEHEPDEREKRKRADALIGDFISEREELREGPRFHVPPFVEKRIEGTRTVFFMPVDAKHVEAPGKVPAVKTQPPADVPETIDEEVLSEPEHAKPVEDAPQKPAPAKVATAAAEPEAAQNAARVALPAEEAATAQPAAAPSPVPSPPPQAAEPPRQGPYEFPARLMSSKTAPASFRRPFMRPDTYSSRKAPQQAITRRPTAKELIAKLRVVREGVETSEESSQRAAVAAAPQESPKSSEPEPETSMAAASPTGQAAAKELEQKADGGKLCPSCGTPISERNRLLICTDCGKMNCGSCNRYELAHMRSDIYYEYQFDFPLCLQCYGKAFSIQRLLGRAGVCYGNGNYTYALYYANQALEQDPKSRYASKARDIIAKTNKAHEQSQERDKEWRLQRKQFTTGRLRQEDPGWR